MNIPPAHAKTCTWLFEQPQFKDWRDTSKVTDHHGFLWIKGKPGCGKSTIMKTALKRAQKERPHSSITIVSYFFNARAPGSLEKSSLGMYRSLVHQLLTAIPDIQNSFTIYFLGKVSNMEVDEWTVVELQGYILSILENLKDHSLAVYIDALDEGEENDIRNMIQFLEEVSQVSISNGISVSICLSSRHYPHISISYGVSLIVENQQGHDQDIIKYVENKLKGDRGDEHETLKSHIYEKASGIFLWVVLVIPMLNMLYDKGDESMMQHRLKDLPAELDGLFMKILGRSCDARDRSILLLQWTLFSYRPISPVELYCAVSDHEIGQRLPSQRTVERYLLNCSRGLTEISKSEPPTVLFIHETIRGFLLQNNGLRNFRPDLGANLTGLSQDQLGQHCFRYLGSDQIPLPVRDLFLKKDGASPIEIEEERKKMEQFPFLEYAVKHGFRHANDAESCGISQRTFLRTFGEPNRSKLNKWIHFNNILEPFKARRYTSSAKLLYIFADNNLPDLVKSLIDDSEEVNVTGERFGNALQAASVHGHEKVARLLLDAAAEVNAIGGEHGHAISAAFVKKKDAVVRLLRDRGAIIPPKLFFAAIASGSTKDAETLLDLGASVEARDKRGDLPLRVAVSYPHLQMVKLLLDRGASVNSLGKSDGSVLDPGYPLQKALVKGHKEVVQLLLDRGADVHLQHGHHGTALETALRYSNVGVVQLLLENGADVNTQGTFWGYRGTALQAASETGRFDVVKLLLDMGADVNAQGGNMGSALQVASRKGDMKVVPLLLEKGADVNVLGGEDWRPILEAASVEGNKEIVQLLLDMGADVNAQGGRYGNALQAASLASSMDLVQLLLYNGAAVNAKGGY